MERGRTDAQTVQALAGQWLAGKAVANAALGDPALVESDPEDIGSIVTGTTYEVQVMLTIPVSQRKVGDIDSARSEFLALWTELDELLNEKLGISTAVPNGTAAFYP